MLRSYLKIAYKVFLRRKFFTFISLFAIAFTLVVLMVATAMIDHTFAPMAPETRQNRTVGVYRLVMSGPHSVISSNPGYKFLDRPFGLASSACRFIPTFRVSSFKAEEDPSYLNADGEFGRSAVHLLEGGLPPRTKRRALRLDTLRPEAVRGTVRRWVKRRGDGSAFAGRRRSTFFRRIVRSRTSGSDQHVQKRRLQHALMGLSWERSSP